MKFASGAAAAALIFVSQALAETAPAPARAVPPSRCGDLPASPVVPDGATADRKAMTAATEAYTAWSTATKTVLDCRRAEVEELRAREKVLTAEYNAGVDQLNDVSNAVVAETAKFNGRKK
jgi:hypothetical protein